MRQTGIALRNATVGFSTQIATAVLGLAIAPFIVRRIGDQAYGLYFLAFSLETLLQLLRNTFSRTSTVVVAQCRESGGDEQINRTVSASVLLALLPAGLGFAVLAGGSEFIYRFFGPGPELHVETVTVMIIAGVVVMVTFPLYPIRGVVAGYQRNDLTNLINLGCNLLRAGLIVVLLTWVKANVILVMLATALSLVGTQVGTTLLAYRLRPTLKIRLRGLRAEDFRPLITFGVFLVLTQVVVTIDGQAANFIVAKVLGIEYITYLAFAGMVFLLAFRMVQQVTVTLVPIAGRYKALGAADTLRELYLRGNRYSVMMALMIVVGLLPQMDLFYRLWLGNGYTWLAPYAIALGCMIPAGSASNSAQQVLQGTGDAKRPFWGLLIATTAGLTTMAVALWRGAGFGGVVAGVCVVHAFRGVALAIIARRVIGGSVGRLMWFGFLQPIVAAIPAVGAVLLLRNWLSPDGWVGLTLLMMTGSVTLLVAFVPFLNQHERQVAKSLLHKTGVLFRGADARRGSDKLNQ